MPDKYMLGYKGIFNNYTVKRNLTSRLSLLIALLSIGVSVFLYFYKNYDQIQMILSKIVDSLVGSLPDLLGFCIGGYAIVVAINSLERMPTLLETQEKTGMSYYLNLSADFAMTLLIMSGLLLIAFSAKLVLDMELAASSLLIGKIVNLSVISFFIWAGAMAVFMIMGTVANLFNTSIILQTVAKIESEKSKMGKDNEDGIEEVTTYDIRSWFGKMTVVRRVKK